MKDAATEEKDKTDEFLGEIEQVCRKHGMSISHEDSQGGFMIERFDEKLMAWLKDAFDNTNGREVGEAKWDQKLRDEEAARRLAREGK